MLRGIDSSTGFKSVSRREINSHGSRYRRISGSISNIFLGVSLATISLLSCDTSQRLEPYRIFVAGARDTQSDLFLFNGNGTKLRQLTDTPDRAEMWPVSTSDSERIYFEARNVLNKEIMLCSLDLESGNEDTLYGPVPPGELWFALSPDARHMAYVVSETTHTSLRIRNISSGHERSFYEDECRLIRPSWSPNSRLIVCQIRCNHEKQWDLALIDIKRGRISRFTDTPDMSEFKARWSPDGSSILTSRFKGSDRTKVHLVVISTDRATVEDTFGKANDRIVSAVWSNTGNLIAVRERPLPLSILLWPTGNLTSPAEEKRLEEKWKRGRAVWSHDSKYIAVNVSESNSRNRHLWRILIMDAAGNIVRRWSDEMSIYCPSWKHP